MDKLKIILTKLAIEFKKDKDVWTGVIFISLIGLFVRTYRQDQLLGFYYDQGRDALRVWEFWYDKKPFLIGPITGLKGIFLGPLFYYLIAPFYILGGWNPVVPAFFLGLIATIANLVIFRLGWKIHSLKAGFLALIISTFSLNLIKAARWLSNPTPILLTSVLLIHFIYKLKTTKNKSYWIAISFFASISMHFESASAIFYFPIILFMLIKYKNLFPDKKTIYWSLGIFFLSITPQIIFNIRHDNILFSNFYQLITGEESFKLSFWKVLDIRIKYFWDVFSSKIIPDYPALTAIFSSIAVLAFITKDKKTKQSVDVITYFLFIPMIGFILFQGNYGNIYDYYMTGYYLPMILLFSIFLANLSQNKLGKYAVLLFLISFLYRNILLTGYYISAGTDGPYNITLGNQLETVDYVINDAGGNEFNVDFYVPPVIPHAYDYLFLWQTTKKCPVDKCGYQIDKQVKLLYTPYEVDPPHPERLEAWLQRQEGLGELLEEKRFGGIIVQKRDRVLYE